MASGTTKVPPLFKEEEMDYDQWKKDIALWTIFTELNKAKHAIAIHLSLSGRARKASSELSVEEMKSEDGVKTLLAKLDRVFVQDANWKCFNTYLAFENYRRSEKSSIDEYLSEFDLRHYKLKECGVTLPDAVVACRLIKSCGLSDMHFQLALSTTVQMTFENMRSTLKKLFAESGHLLSGDAVSAGDSTSDGIKIEPVFENEAYYSNSRNSRGRPWRGGRGNYGGYDSSRRDADRYGVAGATAASSNKRNNPLRPDGTVSVCAICNSKMHWAKNCPHAYENKASSVLYNNDDYNYEQDEEVQITLLAEENNIDEKMNSLLGETIGSVLLDSGCSKTVCGELWLNCFIETLTEEEKSLIKYESSTSMYRFGDGRRLQAEKCATIPCVLAGRSINIKTDVVKCNIPLLLSRLSMKRAGMVMDLKTDTAVVFNKKVNLESTSMGHYILPIFRPPTTERIDFILMNDVESMTNNQVALKLHKQFAHPSSEKLKKLIKDAGKHTPDLIKSVDEVSDNCETCARYKKQRARPVVAMSMASVFNETIAMDLKIWGNGLYFLVLVDLATRYCSAVVIRDKKADTIVSSLFTNWISLFGAPRQFLSDNGGEFNNDVMRTLGDNFGIKLVCTAAESPWSNSICERLNSVLGVGVRKIMHDAQCSIEISLSWAVSARNALQNCHGYSPNQLVFGYNPSFPNVYDGNLSELEKKSSSQLVADNLSAMHAARVDFLKNESNEKLRRAILHQVRSSDVENLVNGDNVFYKRRDSNSWHGPGVVIGKDGKQVLVRHGGIYVRVHTCRLQHAVGSGTLSLDDSSTSTSEHESKGDACSPTSDIQQDSDEEEIITQDANDGFITPSRNSRNRPKIGQRIECHPKGDDVTFVAKILSRAGKVGGIHDNCYNIEKDNGEVDWIDLARQVEKWRPLPEEEALMTSNDQLYNAKMTELQNWKQNEVFDEVENNGQATISVRWVITEKMKDGSPVVKARLVARGFEEVLGDQRTDSPTCARDSFRVALTIISAHGWKCNSIDIKAAFLQGESIVREVWIRPPVEFYNGKLWKLKKTVYGLCDAARAWYFRVKSVLIKMGMVMCSLDQALFFCFENGLLSGIICIHVDDFCWAGRKSFEDTVIRSLQEQFLIGTTSSGTFKYIGVHISQEHNNSIGIHQFDYVQSLTQMRIENSSSRNRADDLSESEKRDYRALVGQLNWLSTQTRPDISFDVCELSSVFDKAKVDDALRANKIVRKVKIRSVCVRFPKLHGCSQFTVECFSDASFGNLEDGGSQGGYLIFVVDNSGAKCPVMWQSRRVRRVVKSTLAAETLALLDSAEAGVYVASLLAESLNVAVSSFLVRCFVDNRSLVDALYSTKAIEDKHLRINMAVLKDMLSKRDISSVSWVQSTHQLANVLTKRGASADSLLSAVGDC